MVVRRKKKHLKFRGHRHQGYGSHKKHRGGGSQGGKGKSGRHKHKWSYVVKYAPETFGKHGFKRPEDIVREVAAINIRQLDERAERFVREKFASKEGDAIKINVTEVGFDKVLGSGRLTKKLIIEAKSFSEEAKRKIEEAGGQAIVIKKRKYEKPAEAKQEKVEGAKKESKMKAIKKKK